MIEYGRKMQRIWYSMVEYRVSPPDFTSQAERVGQTSVDSSVFINIF